MCVHYDAAKHKCNHFDTVSRTWNHVKIRRLAIRTPRFIVDYTIEDAPVCDAASRVATAMVSELRVLAAENVVELYVRTLVVLQTTPILESELVMWLHSFELSSPAEENGTFYIYRAGRYASDLWIDTRAAERLYRESFGKRKCARCRMTQGPSESIQEFAARINKLGTQIFQSGNSAQNTAVRNANDQLLQSRFISGLRNDIRRFVLSRDPLNLDESINAALIEEQNMKLNQIANEERSGHRQAECRKRKRDKRAAHYQPPPEKCTSDFSVSRHLGFDGRHVHFRESAFRDNYAAPRHPTGYSRLLSTPDGDKYEFNRLCFGLKNSPKAFQSIAQEVLGDLLHNGALVYIDDIILFTKTIDEHFELLGRKFKVFTDHKPLAGFLSNKNPSSKNLRWKLALEEFNYDIHYIRGSLNSVADHLSRYINNITIALPDSKDPINMQREDSVLSTIIQKIDQNDVDGRSPVPKVTTAIFTSALLLLFTRNGIW
ncbi:integrase catalytic domain-containing protein [Trichonephila clavipes]|nr:integrase catalytic domain-containing protein [Trichonephila clavipes]